VVKKSFQKNSSNNFKPRKRFREIRKEDYIYFENALVTEALPGTLFKLKVDLKAKSNTEEKIPSIQIVANLKTKLIKKKVLIIKGDKVTVEVNPTDMYFDEEDKILKGLIIERH
jgi:translation initiation factor IF-1